MNLIAPLMTGGGAGLTSLRDAGLALMLALLLGQVTAWIYMYTHSGISYSRGFVQSIVLLTVIVALAMMVIGNNVAVAFGLLGALSMIRFRNVLKDTRDTSFIFFAVVIGIACGTRNYLLALAGAGLFILLLLYLHVTGFGSRRDSDGFLRFHSEMGTWAPGLIRELFHRHCHSTQMVTQRIYENGQMEMAFQLVMRDPAQAPVLVEELQKLEGVSSVNFVLQAEEDEV